MSVNPIPQGYHTVTPYLAVERVSETIAFLQKGFNAEVLKCHKLPNGRVCNAEIRIGNANIMMGEVNPGQTPRPSMLYVYVKDCDAVYRQAVAAGGKSVCEPVDHFYGDRSGAVDDPSGNQWWIATHIRDVSDEEMQKSMKEKKS